MLPFDRTVHGQRQVPHGEECRGGAAVCAPRQQPCLGHLLWQQPRRLGRCGLVRGERLSPDRRLDARLDLRNELLAWGSHPHVHERHHDSVRSESHVRHTVWGRVAGARDWAGRAMSGPVRGWVHGGPSDDLRSSGQSVSPVSSNVCYGTDTHTQRERARERERRLVPKHTEHVHG